MREARMITRDLIVSLTPRPSNKAKREVSK